METKSEFAVWLQSTAGEQMCLGEKCILGRSKECQMVVDSQSASRRHAMIYRQGENEYWLADLGSANGTRVNGRHVSQHRRLIDKDKVEIGSLTFVFRQPQFPAASEPETSSVFATAIQMRSFNCWLLVADMIGSTTMTRLLPEADAAKLTRTLLVEWKEIVEKHQGTVNKFLGDGFLAYWPDSDGVVPEVRAALDDFKRLQGESQTPFRLVLHYGAATSGGGANMGEESLTGKEVNFAFRMEDLASTLGTGVLLSGAAVQKIGSLNFSPQGKHGLAGFKDTFEFFSL